LNKTIVVVVVVVGLVVVCNDVDVVESVLSEACKVVEEDPLGVEVEDSTDPGVEVVPLGPADVEDPPVFEVAPETEVEEPSDPIVEELEPLEGPEVAFDEMVEDAALFAMETVSLVVVVEMLKCVVELKASLPTPTLVEPIDEEMLLLELVTRFGAELVLEPERVLFAFFKSAEVANEEVPDPL
jgi:hypothetical protein